MEATPQTKVDRMIDAITRLLPVLVAVSGGLWGLFTYINDAEDARRSAAASAREEQQTRLVEAQQPFLTRQLELYFETAKIVGELVALEPKSDPEWTKARQRFWELYWSELSMVEAPNVESSMVEFKNFLVKVDAALDKSDSELSNARDELGRSAYRLAHALRTSIESSWRLQSGK